MSSFTTVNPATGDVVKTFEHLSWEKSKKAIDDAHNDFLKWRKYSFEERGDVLRQLAVALRAHKDEIAKTMHLEMGKLLEEGKAEVEKCATTCDYFAKEAKNMLANQAASSPYARAEVTFQPQGVIFSIMPWNFPLWQVIRFAAPALMAGNVIVLKHADLTAGTSEVIGKIFNDLTPEIKLLRNCQVDHEVAEKIIADPRVRGVTFTGSSSGGRAVATTAAKNLKKIVLELGGSDAYLILEDADLDLAAKACAKTRLQNCGQSCVAGKRFIVVQKVAENFIKKMTEEMKKTEIAPLASKKFQATIISQVEKLKGWGGKVVLGGSAPQGAGAFYPPTAVVFEKNNPEIHKEEVFGPVASIIVVKDEKEAVEVANSSPYGLGGGLFTKDVSRGIALAEKELDAGFVVVNDFVKSDPRIPFGGVKESGYGRELGHFGIMEFVNIKTVGIAGENPTAAAGQGE
ncbi:NAD-dependent succinate-semialdehyde dehydrogenase [Bdellovibrio sp. NC01]|uniref:NAD-dependent succinate-semialdehyde dehydrogenase n=1 Tax=Bdellovibrio sp. NC01 TaxID=2220073 RepID=UPI00115B90AC|nr:NAD-dependent succinate-semialdehyde dehydrogenase [Bdellovibrio sp. NC01]QDK37731.1 NAD-dependent succinate-semialdehyde dehydrogenase [Bdellovibrio sp. NC01]